MAQLKMLKSRSGFFRSALDLSSIDNETDSPVETHRTGLLSRASASNLRKDQSAASKRGSRVLLHTRQSIANIWNWRRSNEIVQLDTTNRANDDDSDSSDGNASISTIRPDDRYLHLIDRAPEPFIRSFDDAISPLDLNEAASSVYSSEPEIESEDTVRRDAGEFVVEPNLPTSNEKMKNRRRGVWTLMHPRSSVSSFISHRASTADLPAPVSDAGGIPSEAQRGDAPLLGILTIGNERLAALHRRSVRFEDLELAQGTEANAGVGPQGGIASSTLSQITAAPIRAEDDQQQATLSKRGSRWNLFHKRKSTTNLRFDSTIQDAEVQPARSRDKRRSSVLSFSEVWDRWGPERWQKKKDNADDEEEELVSPITGREEEKSSAERLLRGYAYCADPFGYIADIAPLTRWWLDESIDGTHLPTWVYEESSDPREDVARLSDIGPDEEDKPYSDAGLASIWSAQTTYYGLQCLQAASDPDGFGFDDEDEDDGNDWV